ncbi:MAG TPA: RIP metalloprotease RseP [Prolixibacteraceae bacterium]|nr:RIP metalloprotease RseP [Prolixibacteraceae bacterium]
MVILIKAAQLLLSLSILVILHEFGHFLFAKLFRCRVEKFYLFFDPWFSLFKVQKGETEYGIGWLPLGGYVKIAGMIDESMDKEQMKLPPQPWEFRSKPTWQRLLIMIGGVLFNLILALVLYAMILFTWGEEYLPSQNAKYGIVVSETGREIGLQNGDKIISVDGKHVESFFKIVPTIVLDDAQIIEVQRDTQRLSLQIKKEIIPKLLTDKNIISLRVPFSCKITAFTKQSPARDAGFELGDEILSIDSMKFRFYDEFVDKLALSKEKEISVEYSRNGVVSSRKVKMGSSGLIGIQRAYDLEGVFEYKTIKYSFLESIPGGISKGYRAVGDYLKQFKLLFSPQTKAYESLGGFIAIGNIFPGVWDWESFWNLTAFLSIILAVMNILPIPALDGGHVLFLLYEIITRRKPSDKFLEYAQIGGMVLLFSLLLYANGNDILKLFR